MSRFQRAHHRVQIGGALQEVDEMDVGVRLLHGPTVSVRREFLYGVPGGRRDRGQNRDCSEGDVRGRDGTAVAGLTDRSM